MPTHPTISAVLVIHEPIAVQDSASLEKNTTIPLDGHTLRKQSDQTPIAVSIGLVLDGGRVFWGDCVSTFSGTKRVYPPSKLLSEILSMLKEGVIPALEGQPLVGFQPILEKVNENIGLAFDSAPARKKLPQDPPAARGLAAWTKPPPPALDRRAPTKRLSDKEWILRAIHNSVSQATLDALAASRNLTKAEVIATEYNLPQPAGMIPVLTSFEGLYPNIGRWFRTSEIPSVGLICPVSTLSIVVFPAPDAPMIPRNSFLFAKKEIPFKA